MGLIGNEKISKKYNFLACDFLFEDFYILAVDIIGHPGKSAENSLPASGYDYGRWAGEVIDQLGFDRISLFGGSFGGVIERAEKIIPIAQHTFFAAGDTCITGTSYPLD